MSEMEIHVAWGDAAPTAEIWSTLAMHIHLLLDGFRMLGLYSESSQVCGAGASIDPSLTIPVAHGHAEPCLPAAASPQINRSQLREVVTSLGVVANLSEVDTMFNALDPHGTGTIDLSDLARELRAHRRMLSSKASVATMQGVNTPAMLSSASLSRLPLRPEGTTMSPHETEAYAFGLVEAGRLVEAHSMLEAALTHYRRQLGNTSAEALRCSRAAADVCNSIAMQLLQRDEFVECLRLLKRAEVLSRNHRPMLAVTLNNLACYHRRRGQPKTALGLLLRALDMESRCRPHKPADTHLNTCVVWSQLGKHHEAMHHAKLALFLLRQELAIEGPIVPARSRLEPTTRAHRKSPPYEPTARARHTSPPHEPTARARHTTPPHKPATRPQDRTPPPAHHTSPPHEPTTRHRACSPMRTRTPRPLMTPRPQPSGIGRRRRQRRHRRTG